MCGPWTYRKLKLLKYYSFYDDSIYNQIFENRRR
jgi:hypothetical protein